MPKKKIAAPHGGAADQPARKVVTRSPSRRVGLVHCRWFQQWAIEYESWLERDFIRGALLCPGWDEVRHQPYKQKLQKGTKYTSDFALKAGTSIKVVTEVKPHHKVVSYIQQFNEASERLRAIGIRFYVVTEKEIANALHAGCVKQVYRYAKSELPASSLDGLLDMVRSHGGLSCEELQARTGAPLEYILHLVARRALTVKGGGRVTADSTLLEVDHSDPITAFEQRFRVKPWQARPVEDSVTKRTRPRIKRKPGVRGPHLRESTLPTFEPSGFSPLVGGLSATHREEPYTIRKVRQATKRYQ